MRDCKSMWWEIRTQSWKSSCTIRLLYAAGYAICSVLISLNIKSPVFPTISIQHDYCFGHMTKPIFQIIWNSLYLDGWDVFKAFAGFGTKKNYRLALHQSTEQAAAADENVYHRLRESRCSLLMILTLGLYHSALRQLASSVWATQNAIAGGFPS